MNLAVWFWQVWDWPFRPTSRWEDFCLEVQAVGVFFLLLGLAWFVFVRD